MYQDYWKLQQMPFENIPDPRFLYLSDQHDEAFMRLIYTVKSSKGACMLTGAVGSGKTTILKAFAEKISEGKFQVGIVTNPNLSDTELLQEILYSLNVDSKPTTKIEVMHALRDKLLENRKNGLDTVVVIDEAHIINKKETYEELRLLLNLHEKNHYLVTLILAGQPELKQIISRIPQFEQRIPIKYHLTALSFVDTCKYIAYRLKVSGLQKKIFTADAAKLIFSYSTGIPRKINTICDMSLLSGFVEQAEVIDDIIVKKVIQDEG